MQQFLLLIKPAGPDCNLSCKYCFYSHKTCLFGTGSHRMTEDVLEKMIKDYLSLNFHTSLFGFQGGEPTLMGLDFYKKVIELQKQHASSGQIVNNTLQTNGVLLDENWCKFLHENNFLVGISLDGPKEFHDYYRKDHAGNGTFDKVITGIENSRKHKVEFNILILLNDKNVIAPDKIFDFFIEQNFEYLQFIPCIEKDPASGKIADFSITPKQYGDFLCQIFNRWIDYGPNKISIRLFDSILSYLLTGMHTACTFGQSCNDYLLIEHGGEVFCCDFFVEENWEIGNLLDTNLAELFTSKIKKDFAKLKKPKNNDCLICRHSPICRGGCLKDRLIIDTDYHGKSYFCPAYKRFFDHALGKLAEIAATPGLIRR